MTPARRHPPGRGLPGGSAAHQGPARRQADRQGRPDPHCRSRFRLLRCPQGLRLRQQPDLGRALAQLDRRPQRVPRDRPRGAGRRQGGQGCLGVRRPDDRPGRARAHHTVGLKVGGVWLLSNQPVRAASGHAMVVYIVGRQSAKSVALVADSVTPSTSAAGAVELRRPAARCSPTGWCRSGPRWPYSPSESALLGALARRRRVLVRGPTTEGQLTRTERATRLTIARAGHHRPGRRRVQPGRPREPSRRRGAVDIATSDRSPPVGTLSDGRRRG